MQILLPVMLAGIGYHHMKMIRSVCPRTNLSTDVWSLKSGHMRLVIQFDSVIDKPVETV
jgi:hypothetical protein